MWNRIVVLLLALLPLQAQSAVLIPLHREDGVAVELKPYIMADECAKPYACRFGQLELMGSWSFTGDTKHFGGFSSLSMQPLKQQGDYRFTALSDRSYVWQSDMHFSPGIEPAFTNNEFFRLPDTPDKGTETDSEAINREPDGAYLIGYERNHRIERRYGLQSLQQRQVIRMPPEATSFMESNGSIEALQPLPNGDVLVFSEEGEVAPGFLPVWRMDHNGRRFTRYKYPQEGGYRPTDADILPDGRIFILERSFGLFTGLEARIMLLRSSDLDELSPDEELPLEEIGEIDQDYTMDNLEGLSVQLYGKDIYLFALSDNNFNTRLQSTVLHVFRLNTEMQTKN